MNDLGSIKITDVAVNVGGLQGGRVGDDGPIDQAHSVGRGHRLCRGGR